MKILLTGGTGMVGRNLLEHEGCQKYDMIVPERNELNLLDAAAVESFVGQTRPDIIVHAAGRVGGIQANMKAPTEFLLENLDMGRNVLAGALRCGVKNVINLGSSCMYPRNAVNPLREEMILRGELEPTNEGYAIAKVAIGKLCEYISRQYPGFSYKTLIPCNLYGRWDKFDPESSHLIPAIIDKLHQAKTKGLDCVDIWGDGTARREFMYAGDMADCLVQAVNRFEELPQYMNVGLGEDYSITEYYHATADVVGYDGEFSYDLGRPVGMKQKLVDISKLQKWNWRHQHSLRKGLEKTYEYYLGQVAREDAI